MRYLEDWIEYIEQADGFESRWQRVLEAFEHYGFERLIFMRGDARHAIEVNSNFDASWNEHYLSRGFMARDPFIRYCASTYQPVRTGIAHTKEHDYLNTAELEVINEASDAGFNTGFSCTVERFSGTSVIAWNVGSNQHKTEVDKILKDYHDTLKLLCFHAQRLLINSASAPQKKLTSRECEVLKLMASGLRNKQIAAQLALSISTIEYHLRNIRQKLQAKTIEQALIIAIQRGFITL